MWRPVLVISGLVVADLSYKIQSRIKNKDETNKNHLANNLDLEKKPGSVCFIRAMALGRCRSLSDKGSDQEITTRCSDGMRKA